MSRGLDKVASMHSVTTAWAAVGARQWRLIHCIVPCSYLFHPWSWDSGPGQDRTSIYEACVVKKWREGGCRYNGDESCAWKDWRCGAQAHFSFLHNVRGRGLGPYNFQLWDFDASGYERCALCLLPAVPACPPSLPPCLLTGHMHAISLPSISCYGILIPAIYRLFVPVHDLSSFSWGLPWLAPAVSHVHGVPPPPLPPPHASYARPELPVVKERNWLNMPGLLSQIFIPHLAVTFCPAHASMC